MEALNSISTTTTNNNIEMANMVNINKTLMETLQQQQREIAELKRNMTTQSRPTPASNRTTSDNEQKMLEKLMRMMTGKQKVDKKIFYCWTHGFGTNPRHTSCTCLKPDEGHNKDATKTDRKGGSIFNAKRFKIEV